MFSKQKILLLIKKYLIGFYLHINILTISQRNTFALCLFEKSLTPSNALVVFLLHYSSVPCVFIAHSASSAYNIFIDNSKDKNLICSSRKAQRITKTVHFILSIFLSKFYFGVFVGERQNGEEHYHS